jgi:glycerol kinase
MAHQSELSADLRVQTVTVLSIDAGTSGVTVLIVDADTNVVATAHQDFPQHFPHDGWVEHDPDDIWTATLAATRQALQSTSVLPTCIGITNQRETIVLWDRQTLRAPRRALVWQDRRTTGICDQLRDAGHEDLVRARTGLRLDPYFSATKLAWIREHEPTTWAGVVAGQIAVGTVDSYLIARLTDGRRHVTDPSNASRTLLFDLHSGRWSDELTELFGVPQDALPEIVPSSGLVDATDPDAFLGLRLPIAGLAGDQQAALFGQTCFDPGTTKCTYGTGSFVLANTGNTSVQPRSGLLSTVAWGDADGTLTYALEGAVFVTGAAVQWLRDGLQLIQSATDTQVLGQSVEDSGGVVFVPALTGLGAPHWDPTARGAMFGITRSTTRAHIVRATLDAITFQVRDVVELIRDEAQIEVQSLAVDGGASANNLLCQLQADQLDIEVRRPRLVETTGLGAAFLAGLATGVWATTDELRTSWQLDRSFEPTGRDARAHARWRRAVESSKGWALDD